MYAIGDILSVMRDNGSQGQLHWQTANMDAISFFTHVVYQDLTVGTALVTIDQDPLEIQLQSLTRALVTTTLGLILLGAMLAFPLAQRLYRPIHQLVKAGEALGRDHRLEKLQAGERKDEIGLLLGTFQHMADGMEKKREVEDAFSRFVSPSIAHQVLSGPEGSSLGGVTTEGSVLFCDIVGFTELSEYMQPQEVGELLNQYFSYFSIAADSCRGTVDKFIGDCIMILFGVPASDESHGLQSVTCAVLIQEIAIRVNLQRKKQALPIVQFRIGINSGTMLAGNLGSKERMQYTVVGDVVNLSSRLCDLCAPGEILVTQETLNQSGIDAVIEAHPKKTVQVKGRRQPVTPYAVEAEGILRDPRVQASLHRILPLEW
jgi:adenylate cyclase